MSADKSAKHVDPSGMPEGFWFELRAMHLRGLCDDALAEAIVDYLMDKGLLDDYLEHVRWDGNAHSSANWQHLILHLVSVHMGAVHDGKCLADSAIPLLYTVYEPLEGLGSRLLYVNPGGTPNQFFAFALNFANRGRIFCPDDWGVKRNPGYQEFCAAGFNRPMRLSMLEKHIRELTPMRVWSGPGASATPAAEPSTAPLALKLAVPASPKPAPATPTGPPPRPGWYATFEPSKCNRMHEKWGGCNACLLTNGHIGPHMYTAKNRETGKVEWCSILRSDTHPFDEWDRAAADEADLRAFGAEVLPEAAARVAARVMQQAAEQQAAEQAASAQAPPPPASSSSLWKELGLQDEVIDHQLATEAGTAGAPPATEGPIVEPLPPESDFVKLAKDLEQKEARLASLKRDLDAAQAEVASAKKAMLQQLGA